MATTIVFRDLTAEVGDAIVRVTQNGVLVKTITLDEFWKRGGDTLVYSADHARQIFKALLED